MDKRFAAALRYDSSLPAPFVTARGRGHLAGKIMDAAERFGIPVVSENELAGRLFYLGTGDFVPEEIYQPIATIFAFVMQIDENMGE